MALSLYASFTVELCANDPVWFEGIFGLGLWNKYGGWIQK